ncbi:MAG TPA: MATE family efflux transporter, partial [Chitinophagaceae bacterium]
MQLAISNKQILRIAAPISLALVIPQINHMTNTAFVGRLGEFDLAVVGIAGIYYLIMYMIAYGLNSGMQVLIARRAGELNYPGIGKLFSQGFLLSILFSLLGIMITLSLAPAFFSRSLHSKEIYNSAIAFIRIRIWGLPFLMLTGLSNSFYIGSNHSKVLIISSCFQESVNILFDYLLIFGKWGF